MHVKCCFVDGPAEFMLSCSTDHLPKLCCIQNSMLCFYINDCRTSLIRTPQLVQRALIVKAAPAVNFCVNSVRHRPLSNTCFAFVVIICRSEHDPEQNPAQDAVVRVFNRIVDSANPGLEPAQVFMGRMLLLPPQVRIK